MRSLYASRVIEGKTEKILEKMARKAGSKLGPLCNLVGIYDWKPWLQHYHGTDYFIHGIQGAPLHEIHQTFRRLILEGNPHACELHRYYLDVIGKDYSKEGMTPKLEKVFDWNFRLDPKRLLEHPPVEYGFMYRMILPQDQTKEIVEQVRQSVERNWEKAQESSSLRGVVSQTTWLQYDEDELLMIIHQSITGALDASREAYLSLKDDPFTQERMDRFSQLTGLSYEEMVPELALPLSVSSS